MPSSSSCSSSSSSSSAHQHRSSRGRKTLVCFWMSRRRRRRRRHSSAVPGSSKPDDWIQQTPEGRGTGRAATTAAGQTTGNNTNQGWDPWMWLGDTSVDGDRGFVFHSPRPPRLSSFSFVFSSSSSLHLCFLGPLLNFVCSFFLSFFLCFDLLCFVLFCFLPPKSKTTLS